MSDRKNELYTTTQGSVSLEESFDAICQKPEECFDRQITSNDCSYCKRKDQSQKLKVGFTEINLILND